MPGDTRIDEQTVLDGRDLVDLWTVGHYVDGLVHTAMARGGSSGGMLAMLAHIAGAGPLSTTELAAALGIPFMTASDHVERLIAAGEVRRIPHPTDGRSKLLEVTAAGSRRYRTAEPAVRSVTASIESHLRMPPARVRAALRDLRRAVELARLEFEAAP
jgi:DNA-binding MarR family transcriptional regulator